MYLAEVRIQRFRNLADLKVKLSPGLNVVVGENNIGKSNFLDAIRCALGYASLNGAVPHLTPEDIYTGADGQPSSEPIRVDLIFKGLSIEEQAEFLDCLNYDPEKPENSTASIHYEWRWSEKSQRYSHRRWGGQRTNTEAAVPDENLQAVRAILLDALRDALKALAPGRESRLGRLLKSAANEEDRCRIEKIIKGSNDDLEKDTELVQKIEAEIGKALAGASRDMSQEVVIRSSEAKFDQIVNGLRLMVRHKDLRMRHAPASLSANGLGYNNLIFIGTVLAELSTIQHATLPLLFVEEPEAHLHPQLQTLLADFLATGGLAAHSRDEEVENVVKTEHQRKQRVQTIVTTHSPTIAAHVHPKTIRVLHWDPDGGVSCTNISECGLDESETKMLSRMLDATRAALLFARGIILVEGITEQLLLPPLAKLLDVDLAGSGISVISIAGVSFKTIGKLFGPDKLQVPVAIITDSDPKVVYPKGENVAEKADEGGGDDGGEDADEDGDDGDKKRWKRAEPKRDENGTIVPGPRLERLKDGFVSNLFVDVFSSKITLEYDLACAGEANPRIMFEAWRSTYKRPPTRLTLDELDAAGDREAQALELWRAICLAKSTRRKADLAQALADRLETEAGALFEVPQHIKAAVHHVTSRDERTH